GGDLRMRGRHDQITSQSGAHAFGRIATREQCGRFWPRRNDTSGACKRRRVEFVSFFSLANMSFVAQQASCGFDRAGPVCITEIANSAKATQNTILYDEERG